MVKLCNIDFPASRNTNTCVCEWTPISNGFADVIRSPALPCGSDDPRGVFRFSVFSSGLRGTRVPGSVYHGGKGCCVSDVCGYVCGTQ